jgi:hypothetical protein
MPEFDDFPNGSTLACIIYNVQCTSTDYLSLFLTSLRIRWTIPLRGSVSSNKTSLDLTKGGIIG